MIKNKALASVILWSVISAAFIGPGTVTAAAKAGSVYQLNLLWALTFATIGCVLIQELSARLTIITGLSIGEALTKRYGSQSGIWIKLVLAWPILLGCAAYEAGNILGAVAGLKLLFPVSTELLTIIVTVVALIILWSGKKDIIEWLMALMVALMGIAFIVLASKTHFTFGDYLYYTWVPSMPEGSAFLILGLVGTTIVPYNVFLGSGISGGQTVSLMRLGLIISIVFGGVISAAILVAGTAVPSFTNFSELSIAFSGSFGSIGALALGLGLFAAGFACVITSPFAASIIASSVFHWSERGQKITWMLVLLTGFTVGVSNVNPVVVIVAVQALNGLVLPLITAYLILLINDPAIVAKDQRASITYNIVMILLFAGVSLMGLNDIDHSISSWAGMTSGHWSAIGVVTTGLTGFLSFKVTTLMKNQTAITNAEYPISK